MSRLALLLLFHCALAQEFDQEKCVIDNRSLETMWENKLMDDIKNCSNFNKPPNRNGTAPLIVHLLFLIKYFKFNNKAQEFSASTRTIFAWEDDRLKWNPSKYDGIDTLLSSSWSMWTPTIKLLNSITDEFDQLFRMYAICELNSHGIITCATQIVYKVKCLTDLRDWPYDVQYCKLEFGPFAEVSSQLPIQFDMGRRAFEIIEQGGDWELKDYKQTLNETSDKQVILEFRLERHTVGLAAIVIYPSLILSALTLSSLLIDARLEHRLVVICFSLMCHFYLLTDLTWEFPDNTKDSPNLLMYYRGSFILTSFLIAGSFVLNVICRKEVPCPNWVISVNDFVFLKFAKIFVWPRWETKIEKESEFVKDWTDFANIVNAISIFVSVIVYISLYFVFMPQPNSSEQSERILTRTFFN